MKKLLSTPQLRKPITGLVEMYFRGHDRDYLQLQSDSLNMMGAPALMCLPMWFVMVTLIGAVITVMRLSKLNHSAAGI